MENYVVGVEELGLPSPGVDLDYHSQSCPLGSNAGFGQQEGGFIVGSEQHNVPSPRADLRFCV